MPATFTDRTFEGSTLVLEEGVRFQDCRFVGCQLVYRGDEGVFFEGCIFEECTWTFGGPAENMLIFLAEIYRGLGKEGESLVESIFAGIRSGTVKRTRIAAPVTIALSNEHLRAAG